MVLRMGIIASLSRADVSKIAAWQDIRRQQGLRSAARCAVSMAAATWLARAPDRARATSTMQYMIGHAPHLGATAAVPGLASVPLTGAWLSLERLEQARLVGLDNAGELAGHDLAAVPGTDVARGRPCCVPRPAAAPPA